ncbi:phospholipase A [Marinobacteraceae bacterium S3BR75-40.1]
MRRQAILLTVFVAFSAWAGAEGTRRPPTGPAPQANSVEDCSLIEKGVERLACYDRFLQTEEAAEQTEPAPAENSAAPEDAAKKDSLISRLMAQQKALWSYSGSFLAYRPMYILPITWMDDPNQAPVSENFGATPLKEKLDNKEVKYQISFKLPLLTGVLDNRTTLWFGYTQVSLWQAYNRNESAPFRETNFEPELFLQYATRWDIGPGQLDLLAIGLDHQSNGRSDPFSRSWNRIMGQILYSTDEWVAAIRPWYRIPPHGQDDNPDIQQYLGYAEYNLMWKAGDGNQLGIQLHNNLQTDHNRTSARLMWTFPLSESLDGYVEYFNGYGETLIDYNHRQQRIGIGVMIANWL